MPEALTIGGLASRGGVGVETVRYYQRRKLLATPSRSGGVRRYDEEDVRRLRFVRAGQAAGFTLDQIAELLGLDASQDRERAHALAQERIAALDRRIAALTEAREALAMLAAACAGGGAGPCPIIAAFAGHTPTAEEAVSPNGETPADRSAGVLPSR